LAEKVEEKKLFSCRLFPSIFLIAFLAVSLHEEPKNTIKIFSKIRPENLKKPQKKEKGREVGTSFFFFSPLAPLGGSAVPAAGSLAAGAAAPVVCCAAGCVASIVYR
jgi:hypothetical protein